MQPRLPHPIKTTIQQIDVGETLYDEDTKEPIGQSKRTAVFTIPGQPNWSSKNYVTYDDGGTTLTSRGYILVRYVDMESVSYTPKRQDLITSIGHTAVHVFLMSSTPIGHYPHLNGAAFLKLWFTDRQPSKTGDLS